MVRIVGSLISTGMPVAAAGSVALAGRPWLADLRVLVAMAVDGAAVGPALGPSGTLPGGQDDAPDPAEAARLERVRALVELAQRGDAEAFGQLYEEYVDVVYRYVYVRVGSRQLAEDITSETFLKALRRLDAFRWQGRDIAAWFVTIARNLVTDHHRAGRTRMEITTEELLGADAADAGDGGRGTHAPGPEDAVLERSRNERLVEAVRQLKPEQQECLVLRFFHEMSLAETAQVLGRSEGAVKQLQLRAVRALAGILGERP
ncbi:MAG: sigma-70 family RNA polymerase sigma factor [Actinomycetota bacterium]